MSSDPTSLSEKHHRYPSGRLFISCEEPGHLRKRWLSWADGKFAARDKLARGNICMVIKISMPPCFLAVVFLFLQSLSNTSVGEFKTELIRAVESARIDTSV